MLRPITLKEAKKLIKRHANGKQWAKAKYYADTIYGAGRIATLKVSCENLYNDETYVDTVTEAQAYDFEGGLAKFDLTLPYFDDLPDFYNTFHYPDYQLKRIYFEKLHCDQNIEELHHLLKDYTSDLWQSLPTKNKTYDLRKDKWQDFPSLFVEEE